MVQGTKRGTDNAQGQAEARIGGKDIILYILKKPKRNTVAVDYVVEYILAWLQVAGPERALCHRKHDDDASSHVLPVPCGAGHQRGLSS